MNKVSKVVLKNTGCHEDFIAILLNNGYKVITELVSGGDQIEIQFYQEEQYAKGGVIPPTKKLRPEFVDNGEGYILVNLVEEPEKKETPEEMFGKIMEKILEGVFGESEE